MWALFLPACNTEHGRGVAAHHWHFCTAVLSPCNQDYILYVTVHAGYEKILKMYEGRFTKYHLRTVFFLFPLCLQGEVVEFIDEFLDAEEPILERPPKD